MRRSEERKQIMFELYRMDLLSCLDYKNIEISLDGYRKTFFEVYFNHKEDIDNMINSVLKGWDIKTLNKIDLACLRACTCELLYMSDIPKAVSINEAVELAKIYGDERSYTFVNGVLRNFV